MKTFTESNSISELFKPLIEIFYSFKSDFKKAGLYLEKDDNIARVDVDDQLVIFKFRFSFRFTEFTEFQRFMNSVKNVFNTFETKDYEHFFYPISTDESNGNMELMIRIDYEDLKNTNIFKSASSINKYKL